MCIATGPSLTVEQIKRVWIAHSTGRVRVIAVNEAGLARYKPLAAPFADILYAADAKFWRAYHPINFAGLKVSADDTGELKDGDRVIYPAIETQRLEVIGNMETEMPREPGKAVSGSHSGFQALGLALTLGAARILLLGYDCGGGKRNCHTGRPDSLLTSDGAFINAQGWYNYVPLQWPDVEVINCSPLTAIKAFPLCHLEEVLP